MSTIRAFQVGKAGVLAYPRGLFHVVSESCKVQGQCLILVGCRQEVLILEIALDRDGASLAFEGRMDDGRGVERAATDRDMAAWEEDAEASAQDCGCALQGLWCDWAACGPGAVTSSTTSG